MPGKANVVPGDAYANMTSAEFWRNTWQGQRIRLAKPVFS
jgi:hypothetical protein